MRGRQVFMESLLAHGVERIFGNPGTTESPLLDSLSTYSSIRYVTALHEGIALGAASYYAQASGKTGVVSLHVAPGLGNAIGMLYGAMRANSPLIVTAGQQDTRMRLADPILGHDLVAMAAPVTKWSVQVEHADEMAPILRRAFKIASDGPAGPVFVALPINVMEQETEVSAGTAGVLYRSAEPDPEGIAAIVQDLLAARNPVIVCGDDVARSGGSKSLAAIAEAIGAPVWFEGLRMHNAFPTAHPCARLGLPLDAAGIRKCLAGADLVLLVGGPFFEDVWYSPARPFPDGAIIIQIEASPARLAHNHSLKAGIVADVGRSLQFVADGIAARTSETGRIAAAERMKAIRALKDREIAAQTARAEKAWNRDPISMPRVVAEIAAALPPKTVVVDESITASIDLARSLEFAAPGDYFGARGGGIGQGLAGALGVQIACPDRPVICISGDGSAMYSIQALWTAAHLDLAIVFVILANREYRILKHNIDVYRQRFGISSQEPYAHMDLGKPALGFVEMAQGMGVAGTRVTRPEAIKPAVELAFQSYRPHLIEIAVEAKR